MNMKNAGNKSLSPADFYDDVSEFYEKMIDFEKNLELRVNAYKNIFEITGPAADLGCGVGLDAIALAMNGHVVTAFDVSPKMIEAAKANSSKYNVKLKTSVRSIESIPNTYKNKFQNVVCVGNTIAHFNAHRLKTVFKKIYILLKPSGKVFLHILNYELIKKLDKRINNIANRDEMIIIRFYDFFEQHLNFNILSFRIDTPKIFNLVTTLHYPHSKNEIRSFLKSAGFDGITFSKNFKGKYFNPLDSKDMFITATK